MCLCVIGASAKCDVAAMSNPKHLFFCGWYLCGRLVALSGLCREHTVNNLDVLWIKTPVVKESHRTPHLYQEPPRAGSEVR